MTLVAHAPAALSEPGLRRVTDHIEAHLHRPLTLTELAMVAGMSRYHFARRFKASTGVPPHRFITQRRIERAKALLREGTLPIGTIATTVGFRTPSHFTAVFHRVTGLTAGAYRVAGVLVSGEGS